MKLNRPVIILLLALLAGLLATALAARWLQAQTAGALPLVVAQSDIPLGTPLEASMLTTLAWPAGAVPQGAVHDPGALIGRVTRSAVARHEPLLESKLATAGARGGLSAAIAPGKRAITVKVNEVVGVAGFALPGSVVDVMVHTQTDDTHNQPSAALSKIVLERILVLAVAQESARDAMAPKVANAVTLEVTPEEAEQLDLARSVGSLSLVLRNPADLAPAHTGGARKRDLVPSGTVKAADAAVKPVRSLGSPHPHPMVSRAEAPPASAEVIRGLDRSTDAW